MPRLVVLLLGAVLVLSACGGDAGSPRPVSGASSTPAPTSSAVSGQVRDAGKRPVRGALVVPRPMDATTPGVPEIAVLTDAGGRFTWQLPPGSYELVASLGDRRSKPAPVKVTAGSMTPYIDIVLPD